MRWLLEPAALGQAMERLDRDVIESRRKRVAEAQRHPLKPGYRERLEIDLHVDTVLECDSGELRDAIRRNQFPLIATHSTFARQSYPDEIDLMLAEHLTIFDHILAGRKRRAMAALEAHIRRSLQPNVDRLTRLGRCRRNSAGPSSFRWTRWAGERTRRGQASISAGGYWRRPDQSAPAARVLVEIP